ncbi:MAG TPA: DUF502 domain-containing protein [Gammaproteobacteria bacterium]|nr:DUF502 domain-containing protein [Gammaproteobacteria bacterium]
MRLRRYLVAGLLVWLPVGVTILVFKVLLDLMDRLLFLIPAAYRPETVLGFRIPGLGALLAVIVLFATGVLGANLLGRRLVVWYESLLNRIPLVRTVYGGVKNFASVVLNDRGPSFKKVLLIEYPSKGLYRIAFQTGEEVPEIVTATGRDVVPVFVPTSPNAASGFVVFAPRAELVELSMSVEEALKLVISLGVVVPEARDGVAAAAAPLAHPQRSP